MKILLRAKAQRGKVPPALAERPVLPEYLKRVITAFWSLHGDRSDHGPIHYAAIDAYGRRAGMTGEAFTRFERRIRACDAAYLAFEAERRKDEIEQAKREARRRG